MIELNLLPKHLRAQVKKKKDVVVTKVAMPKLAPTPVIIGLIAVLLLSQIITSVVAMRQRKSLALLSAALKSVAQDHREAIEIKKELDALNGKVSIIDSLAHGSLIWSKKLSDLNDSMIDGVWLTSLSVGLEVVKAKLFNRSIVGATPPQDKQILILKGTAVSPNPGEETAVVGKFIESLRSDEGFFGDFEDIKLSSIQRRALGSSDVMDFTIVCYFQSGRSYFEKLETGNN
ncbi:PilN domain-containing protein [Candidatus Omnitrophota bacterium]